MEFPKKLKEEREKRDLTQIELAKAIGITNVMVSRYENGKRTPDFATLEAFAKYFGCTTDHLLGRAEKETSTPRFVFPNLETEQNPDYDRYSMRIKSLLDAAVKEGDLTYEDVGPLAEEAENYIKFRIEEKKKKHR
jgi:transcriptional regulator with XRE-family HTH domain